MMGTGAMHRYFRSGALCLAGLVLATLGGTGCAPPKAVPETLYSKPLAEQQLNIEPVRGELRQLVYTSDDTSVECTFCHDSFAGDLQKEALENTHASIEFNHGRNLRCLNCHNENNPDTFVAYDGSEIPADQPEQLCSKCHGPHYRDWEIGIHGRSNGHWSSDLGERTKLVCTQCHNPHKPHFPMMVPDPPVPLTRFQHTFALAIEPLVPAESDVESDSEPEPSENTQGGAEHVGE